MIRLASFALKVVLALLAVTTFSSCRSESESGTDGVATVRPLIVVFGGNASCVDNSPINMPMYRRFVDLKRSVEKETSVMADFVITCYPNLVDTIYYTSSHTPGKIVKTDLGGLMDHLQRYFTDHAPITVMGYSYGGWLALKVALGFNPSNDPLLFTIDPISRKRCKSGNLSDCTRFPSDVDGGDRDETRSKTSLWHHVYQTKTIYLHSSSVEQADVSKKLSETHFTIQTAGDVWNDALAETINQAYSW
jgi:hypothetical protein